MAKLCGNVHQFVAICLFLQRCDNMSHECFLFISQQETNEMEMCWKHAELTVVAAAVCVATSTSVGWTGTNGRPENSVHVPLTIPFRDRLLPTAGFVHCLSKNIDSFPIGCGY